MICVISATSARENTILALGLDACTYGIRDTEVLAGLTRRAASLLAPCPPRALRERVLIGLRGLIEGEQLQESVDSVIEALTSYGDLIELPGPDEDSTRTYLYVAPPSFVETSPGTVFLLGVATDGQSILPESLAQRIQHRGHTRRIQYVLEEALPLTLRQLGLHSLPEKLWFRQPALRSAAQTKEMYDVRLDATTVGGDVSELLVLNPTKSVTYYRGRWEPPKRLSGRVVARRDQRYGAPLWCYAELKDGVPTRLLDLLPGEWRGCDLAWQLQMAIDALAGTPQQFGAALTDAGTVIVKLFSPVPAWWQRRWDVLGMPVKATGCLCAYELDYAQYESDLPRMTTELWLTERPEHT